MNKPKTTLSKRRKIGATLIILFCIAVTVCVASVLLFVYKPEQNSLKALGTVSMDVISMIILIMILISFAFERNEFSRTSILYLLLLVASVWAILMDFLTWSSDGQLELADWTFLFTILSLCMGGVLAGIFVMYLCGYIRDMYGITSQHTRGKICVLLNVADFVLTLTLGLSGYAFEFVDGHYELGVLYDVITVIPILTLLYMTAYVIKNRSIIGGHDVFAVAGYIFTMIMGALIEAQYAVGATYVSVAIADVYIFIMLQNKLMSRVKQQKEELTERISSQYEILESMTGIYSYVNYIDFDLMMVRRFDDPDSSGEKISFSGICHSALDNELHRNMEEKHKAMFWKYTDLSTLPERMANEKIISAEFQHKKDGWFRAQYIRIGDTVDEPVKRVIYAIRNINEEKKNVEMWIQKSNTDELTGFYNRHAYEDDVAAIEKEAIKNNFVYVSVDVNGLKTVNDSKGHDAGDEMLIGACECMKQCFGAYGKLYRTGGDEFVALIFADESQLAEIKKDIDEVTENWRGELVDHLAVSCGYVTAKESDGLTIHQMAVLADKRMYEAKNRYYREKGIDRRGQRDAYLALCALYTKILKINITDDTYQIINMNDEERTAEKGFSDKISAWFINFGESGQVHPDDLENYKEHTSLQYIRDYFKNNNPSLSVSYRRKCSDGYRRLVMEMIPANDYSEESQNLFLYVKNVEQ